MTRPVFEDGYSKEIARGAYRTSQLERRPSEAAGATVLMIKVFEDDVVLEAGDNAFIWDVPEDLDGSVLLKAEAWVTTPSGSGIVNVQLRKVGGSNMLSTPLTIDVGELSSDHAATPHVVDGGNDDLTGDNQVAIDVDNAGDGAMGLGVTIYLTPAAIAAVTVRGARGPAGGVTTFVGPWTTATGYTAGDVVTSSDGVAYVATDDHTSGATTEPGVGVDWEDHWVPLVNVPLEAGLTANIFSSAGAVPLGQFAIVEVPFDATIVAARIASDIATDATIDIWKCDWGGYPPSVGDSITAAAPPTLTGAVKNEDTTLTGWDTSLAEGDILAFVVTDITFARRLHLILKFTKGA